MLREPLQGLCKHGVLKTMRCSQCEVEARPAPEPKVGPDQSEVCFVRIVLKYGMGTVDVRMLKPFNLPAYVAMVKGGGGVVTEDLHVPWDNILAFFVVDNPNDPRGLPQQISGLPQGQRAN
jgi:hypothetical protein